MGTRPSTEPGPPCDNRQGSGRRAPATELLTHHPTHPHSPTAMDPSTSCCRDPNEVPTARPSQILVGTLVPAPPQQKSLVCPCKDRPGSHSTPGNTPANRRGVAPAGRSIDAYTSLRVYGAGRQTGGRTTPHTPRTRIGPACATEPPLVTTPPGTLRRASRPPRIPSTGELHTRTTVDRGNSIPDLSLTHARTVQTCALRPSGPSEDHRGVPPIIPRRIGASTLFILARPAPPRQPLGASVRRRTGCMPV
jgi:hypothetical protein